MVVANLNSIIAMYREEFSLELLMSCLEPGACSYFSSADIAIKFGHFPSAPGALSTQLDSLAHLQSRLHTAILDSSIFEIFLLLAVFTQKISPRSQNLPLVSAMILIHCTRTINKQTPECEERVLLSTTQKADNNPVCKISF